MSIFNRKQYYSQRDNINESSNRIVNMWNFVINFTNYLNYDAEKVENLNELLMYNVKSVELPKYTMKTYKRYYGGSERSFPIKRVCDGSFKVTFYGRYEVLYALSRICQNFVGNEEVTNSIKKVMKQNELDNYKDVVGEVIRDNAYIEIIQLPDTLRLDANGKIRYMYMKPVLSSIECSELNSENNAIIEITCEFMYKDFRIVTDSYFTEGKNIIKGG